MWLNALKINDMFDSLSNAMNPTKIPQIKQPNATKSQQKDKGNDKTPDLVDVKLNLPNFDLQPIDDFDTIDEELLANLVYDTNSDDQNQQKTTQNVASVLTKTTQTIASSTTTPSHQINTQVINQNIPMLNFPHLPPMYFPNSNVTINYNIGK